MQIYCYGPHLEAVKANLTSCGLCLAPGAAITPIHGRTQLAGLRGGVFVSVENHREEIPESILYQAERAGMIWVGLSDEWMRDAAEARL